MNELVIHQQYSDYICLMSNSLEVAMTVSQMKCLTTLCIVCAMYCAKPSTFAITDVLMGVAPSTTTPIHEGARRLARMVHCHPSYYVLSPNLVLLSYHLCTFGSFGCRHLLLHVLELKNCHVLRVGAATKVVL